jgi:hypothetical protein
LHSPLNRYRYLHCLLPKQLPIMQSLLNKSRTLHSMPSKQCQLNNRLLDFNIKSNLNHSSNHLNSCHKMINGWARPLLLLPPKCLQLLTVILRPRNQEALSYLLKMKMRRWIMNLLSKSNSLNTRRTSWTYSISLHKWKRFHNQRRR